MIIVTLYYAFVILCGLFIVKVLLAGYWSYLILDAVFVYLIEKQNDGYTLDDVEVDFDDLEDIDRTIWRLWDWGYGRILPKEKLKIIKPYIKIVRENRKAERRKRKDGN